MVTLLLCVQTGAASMMAKYKSGVIKGWKPFIFKIANTTHIRCLDPKSSVSLNFVKVLGKHCNVHSGTAKVCFLLAI